MYFDILCTSPNMQFSFVMQTWKERKCQSNCLKSARFRQVFHRYHLPQKTFAAVHCIAWTGSELSQDANIACSLFFTCINVTVVVISFWAHFSQNFLWLWSYLYLSHFHFQLFLLVPFILHFLGNSLLFVIVAIVAMMAIKDKAILTCKKEIHMAMMAIVVIAEKAAFRSIGAMNGNDGNIAG